MKSRNIPSSKIALGIMIALVLIMLATRAFHVASALHLPDATWALFFIAGYYLGFTSFGVLIFEAVLIDLVYLLNGGDPYCFSVAYGFLGVAYLALWFCGYWASRTQMRSLLTLVRGAAAWFVAAGVAYLLTNGSFYWLSGKVAEPTFAGWMQNASMWAFGFIVQPMVYLGVAAAIDVIAHAIKPRELAVS